MATNTNTIIAATAHALTMSTLEIAGLTGKQHGHVLRDADKMLSELGITESKFGGFFKGENGKESRVLNLPKRECFILVSGYSVELRSRIVDRWLELESALTLSGLTVDDRSATSSPRPSLSLKSRSFTASRRAKSSSPPASPTGSRACPASST